MNKATIVENQTKDNTSGKPSKRIRDDKPRKKDDKSVDHVLKALDSLGTTEEKLGAMCQKYAEMFNDHRMLQTAVKQAERKNTLLQKEKEQLQTEHSKAILTRSRLENLCRELQRQNKAVKEECMLKMREEGEKKREVAAKFHSMLSEIGSLLAQNNDKNAKLRDDNLDMSMRLKSVCDQFEKKEQHVENLAKQMQLEMQLADAKLAKAKMEMDIEKETLQKEKQQLLIELADYKRKLCEMKASELALREQITMYSEKYEEFHKALLQSNSAIGEFKAEMERMTKHIRRLEKETATWKSRYDAAQRTLAEVTQGKIRSDEALGLSQRRLTALQGICRGLQDQCRQLRGETRRNSQTDEDYKKLEAQIKEVERANDLDTQPCPRKVSSCSEADIQVNSQSTDDICNIQRIEPTDTLPNYNSSPMEISDIHKPEPTEISDIHKPEPSETSNIHNSESSDTSDIHKLVLLETSDIHKPEVLETSDIHKPGTTGTSDILKSESIEPVQIDMNSTRELESTETEKDVSGVRGSVLQTIDKAEIKGNNSMIEIIEKIKEIGKVIGHDETPPAEINCSTNSIDNSLNENYNIQQDSSKVAGNNDKIESSVHEPVHIDMNSIHELECTEISETENNDATKVTSGETEKEVLLKKKDSFKVAGNKDKLEIAVNSASSKCAENGQSIEDCVNNLVNHIQEVSLLEGSSNIAEKPIERVTEEPERTCSPNEVHNSTNKVIETVHIPEVSLTSESETNGTDHTNSNGNACSNDILIDSTSRDTPKDIAKDGTEEGKSIISHKVTISPDDVSLTKSKKKRKSKNNK